MVTHSESLCWVDTHAHFYDVGFDEDRSSITDSLKLMGFKRVLLPNIDLDSVDAMLKLQHQDPEFYASMLGLHPCSVKAGWEEDLDALWGYKSAVKWCAIGEIGLDFYWDKTWVMEQEKALCKQLEYAAEMNLPVVLHARESLDRLIDMVCGSFALEKKGVFHCFTGGREQARKIIDSGYYLGIGGVLTFKNSELKDLISYLPWDALLLETDSPYLAPVPFRGKRNHPGLMIETARYLALSKGVSLAYVSEKTSDNAQKLFSLNL